MNQEEVFYENGIFSFKQAGLCLNTNYYKIDNTFKEDKSIDFHTGGSKYSINIRFSIVRHDSYYNISTASYRSSCDDVVEFGFSLSSEAAIKQMDDCMIRFLADLDNGLISYNGPC